MPDWRTGTACKQAVPPAVPTQRVKVDLPFEIESVVVANEKLPILKRNAKGKLVPDQK